MTTQQQIKLAIAESLIRFGKADLEACLRQLHKAGELVEELIRDKQVKKMEGNDEKS